MASYLTCSYICNHDINHFLTCFTGPRVSTVIITKNIESSSLVIQWDKVDDSLPTNYTVTWTWTSNRTNSTVTEQSSYTITGLTLDTVYTITVTASNRCGQGPEYRTSVLLIADSTSITSSITLTATAGTTFVTTTNAITINITTTTATTTASTTTAIISTSNAMMSPSATVIMNRDTDATSIIATTGIVVFSISTTNPADKTMADDTSKFLSI